MSRQAAAAVDEKPAVGPGPLKPNPVDPSDESVYLAEFRQRDEEVDYALPLKPGVDVTGFHFKFFRTDELVSLRRQIEREHWNVVSRDGSLPVTGQPFAEVFDAEAFDQYEDGVIGRGRRRDGATGRITRELTLMVQPVGAYRAGLRVRAEGWKEYKEPLREERIRKAAERIGQDGRVPKGTFSFSNDAPPANPGEEPDKMNAESRSGWDALG